MKVKFVAILTLVALSCQKEKVPEQKTVNSTTTSELSLTTTQLLADPNFVKFYKISLPIFNALRQGRNDLFELYNDTLVYPKECKTLAHKLGFIDSAALAKYFQQLNMLAPKIAKAHPTMTLKQCQDAITQLNTSNLVAPNPCQDAVVGQFIMNVAECGALGLIPVIGEALAGTCMVGALITYNAGMQSCASGNE